MAPHGEHWPEGARQEIPRHAFMLRQIGREIVRALKLREASVQKAIRLRKQEAQTA